MAGEIVHIELPSSDFAQSAAFYGKLFGWKTDGVQSGGHLLFELPGGVQGSWIRVALAQAPGPVPFVAVADVDKALDEAQKQGGRVLVRKLPLATRGAFGLLADRDGNVIGVLAVKGGAGGGGAGGGGAPEKSATAAGVVAAAAAASATAAGKKIASAAAPNGAKAELKPVAKAAGKPAVAPAKTAKKPAARKR